MAHFTNYFLGHNLTFCRSLRSWPCSEEQPLEEAVVLPGARNSEIGRCSADLFKTGVLQHLHRSVVVYERGGLQPVQPQFRLRRFNRAAQCFGSNSTPGIFAIHPVADIRTKKWAAHNSGYSERTNNVCAGA